MATLRFLLKRFAAQRLLGLAVIVTLAFSVGVLVAGPIYADAAREAIFSSTLSDAGVTVANARYQVFGDEDFDWANADAAVEGALTGVPTDTIVSQGLSTVRFGDTEGPSLPVFFREGAADHLQIRGEAPAAGEIALPSSTAQTAGLQLGDPVTIVGPNDETVTLTLSGTYGSPDREDPFWFGSRNPFPGPDATDPPPLLMDREAYLEAATTLGLTSEFAWDAYLAVGDLTYDEARSVPGQLLHAEDVMSEQPGMTTVRLTTGLDTLFGIVDQRVQNLRIPILLVVIQIGAVTLAVLAGVGALALTRQSFELAVLHSRGFTKRTLLTAQGLQALTYAVVAYPLGLLLGLVLAKLAGRSNGKQLPGVVFPVHLNAGAELLGLLAAAAGAAILFGLSYPLVKRTVLEERRAASREDRPLLARVPVELFVLPLGIFAYLQLRGGTEVTPGGGTIDPLVLAAPTLLLFGISFLALRLLLVRASTARRADRTDATGVHLPGGSPGRALPGHRVRRGAPAAAGDGAAGGLDLLPGDRAAQPRRRRAHAGRRRLERAGESPRTGPGRHRRPSRGSHRGGAHRTDVLRRELLPAADRAGHRSRHVRGGRLVAIGLLLVIARGHRGGIGHRPARAAGRRGNADARPRRPRPSAGHAGPGHGVRRRRPGAHRGSSAARRVPAPTTSIWTPAASPRSRSTSTPGPTCLLS